MDTFPHQVALLKRTRVVKRPATDGNKDIIEVFAWSKRTREGARPGMQVRKWESEKVRNGLPLQGGGHGGSVGPSALRSAKVG